MQGVGELGHFWITCAPDMTERQHHFFSSILRRRGETHTALRCKFRYRSLPISPAYWSLCLPRLRSGRKEKNNLSFHWRSELNLLGKRFIVIHHFINSEPVLHMFLSLNRTGQNERCQMKLLLLRCCIVFGLVSDVDKYSACCLCEMLLL